MRALNRFAAPAACFVALATWVLLGGAPAVAQTPSAITDIATGLPILYPSYITEYDGQLYFRGSIDPSSSNTPLWRSNGDHAELVPGVVPQSLSDLAAWNGKLHFTANSKLWQYDPVGGAMQAPGAATGAQNPAELTPFGNRLYFRAARFSSTNIGIELWRFDGTNQTPVDLFPGTGSSYPQHFIEYAGELYFNANGQPGQGSELYRTAGLGTPVEAAQIYPGNGSSPENFAVFGGQLYFSAYDGVHGRELWRYDTTAGAALVADIVAGGQYSSSNPSGLAVYNGKLYFAATDPVRGNELWCYDGTQATLAAEINPTPDPGNGDTFLMDSNPGGLTVWNGLLYFAANDGVHGRELWSFDGSSASLVRDINPGQYGSEPSEFTVYDGKLLFSADDGYNPALRGLRPQVFAMAVPEPGAWVLLLIGVLAALGLRRSK